MSAARFPPDPRDRGGARAVPHELRGSTFHETHDLRAASSVPAIVPLASAGAPSRFDTRDCVREGHARCRDQPATVTYEKIVVQKIVPNLPVEQRTIETWSTSTAPLTERQVVTLAGGRRFEIGSGPGQDKVLGALEVDFLYDASTKTIYRTGYYPVEASETNPSRKSAFKHVLAEPGVRLTGTRLYRGRPVFVLEAKRPGLRETTLVESCARWPSRPCPRPRRTSPARASRPPTPAPGRLCRPRRASRSSTARRPSSPETTADSGEAPRGAAPEPHARLTG